METNFFKSIEALAVAGDWTISIAKENADTLIVSVLFHNSRIGDDARRKVPPILLRGSTEELDLGFFKAIEQPVKETAELFTNMEQFLKQKEVAKASSQMHKQTADKAEKQISDKQKNYQDAMKKVDELEAEGKHREAWMKVPQVEIYPEYAQLIKDRRMELSAQFAPDLFNEPKKEESC
ncbi:PRTRC genetic system protein E [Flavobacterium sp. 90]|uniref:prtrc system protein e n=1 Tax=unclassified Flavobacterium TaxID=196869 RepID=UPI000EB1D68E|nr:MULTISPECIES: prtrc system protein e [unclassified Flavobacterium]RKR05132.1 PRTRC genetic system protein E [Flavobacterium sp. 81]TCK56447.1 PRTRC genetic system protein E [Flavobacterium sp. 90]